MKSIANNFYLLLKEANDIQLFATSNKIDCFIFDTSHSIILYQYVLNNLKNKF